jgi:hypothetical protein
MKMQKLYLLKLFQDQGRGDEREQWREWIQV